MGQETWGVAVCPMLAAAPCKESNSVDSAAGAAGGAASSLRVEDSGRGAEGAGTSSSSGKSAEGAVPEFLSVPTLLGAVRTQRNHFRPELAAARSALCGEHKDRNDPESPGSVIPPFQYMTMHTQTDELRLLRTLLDLELGKGLPAWQIGNTRSPRGGSSANGTEGGDGSAAWQFCHMLPLAANQPWLHATRYTVDDVVVGVFTGALYYRSRALATLDTWLQRFPNHYFYSRTADDVLDVISVKAQAGYLGAVQKQNEGMKHMLREHPDAPWFYLVGCDTWAHPDHLLLILDEFEDPSVPVYLGGNSGTVNLARQRLGPAKLTGPGTVPGSGELIFHSGGSGFLLSNGLMKRYVEALDAFVAEKWPPSAPQADVLAAWLCNDLGVGPSTRSGFHGSSPEWVALTNPSMYAFPAAFHHLTGPHMIDLDEFYAHQRLDRMVNAGQWDEVERWARAFIGEHYRVLRRKYAQVLALSAAFPREDVDGKPVEDRSGLSGSASGAWAPWNKFDLDALATRGNAWGEFAS